MKFHFYRGACHANLVYWNNRELEVAQRLLTESPGKAHRTVGDPTVWSLLVSVTCTDVNSTASCSQYGLWRNIYLHE